MRQASKRVPDSAKKTVRDIRRATRRHHSAEEKIRIVLEGLRGEDSIAELCREEGINQNLCYRWSKEFLEAGKKRFAGDTAREATSDEVKKLKAEARQLKETLAEVLIENRLLKKSVLGDGEDASCGILSWHPPGCESAGACLEVPGFQFLADLSGTRLYVVQTVVTPPMKLPCRETSRSSADSRTNRKAACQP